MVDNVTELETIPIGMCKILFFQAKKCQRPTSKGYFIVHGSKKLILPKITSDLIFFAMESFNDGQ
jgi:hypothetical protein